MQTHHRLFPEPGIPFFCAFLAFVCLIAILFGLGAWLKTETSPELAKIIVKLIKSLPPVKMIEPTREPFPLESQSQSIPMVPKIVEKKSIPENLKPAKKVEKKPKKAKSHDLPPNISRPALPITKPIEPYDTVPTQNKRESISPSKKPLEPLENERAALNRKEAKQNDVAANKLDDSVRERFFRQIMVLLEKGKHYPAKARRMNLDGVVLVTFQLDKSGKILNARVKSGTHKILANSALELLMKTQLPKPPKEWQSDFSIEIPINYKIK